MGYFQEQASKPEAIAKRIARVAKARAEMATKHFENVDELVAAYAAEHKMTETETRAHLRKEWDGPGTDSHKWVILCNLKSAYSGPWGIVQIN